MALNPPASIDRRGKQPLRNFDGSFSTAYPTGNKSEPSSSFAEGNEITITSADSGFTFGEKAQAAPIFYWHGRDVWVNGVRRDDYDLVSDGEVVPYGPGDVFGNRTFSSASDAVTFLESGRMQNHLAIHSPNPRYFGYPAGYAHPMSYRTSYFSWRAKYDNNYLSYGLYEYDTKTGDFLEGEEVIFDNGVEIFGPVTIKGFGYQGVAITTLTGFESLANADLPGTMTGQTSGATANIISKKGLAALKNHRFDVIEGDDLGTYDHASSMNSFAVKVTGAGGVTQYIDTGVGAGGYHNFRFDTGEWEFFECSDIFTGDVGYSFWNVTGEGGGRQYANQIDTTELDFDIYPNLVTLGLDSSGGGDKADTEFFLSDIYWDNTCQRVFVSNSSTFNGRDKSIELQLPTAWSNTSVQFQCVEGAIDTAQPVYAYIVDDFGRVNGVDIYGYQASVTVVAGILVGGA